MRQQLFVLFIHLPVVDIQQSETQDESRREKHQLQRCFERHGAARRLRSCSPQQVNPNHGSSKLLSARPTAIARRGARSLICSSFCRAGSITILRNGYISSTGTANSSRSTSINPGTRELPPATIIV